MSVTAIICPPCPEEVKKMLQVGRAGYSILSIQA